MIKAPGCYCQAHIVIAEKRKLFFSFSAPCKWTSLRHDSYSAYKGRDSTTGSLGPLRVGGHE